MEIEVVDPKKKEANEETGDASNGSCGADRGCREESAWD
jgi:hypothetical protein